MRPPSVMPAPSPPPATTRDLAKRLIRSLARRSVYIPKSRQEGVSGPYTRMLGLEDEIEQSAREDWAQHLKGLNLYPSARLLLHQIIQAASVEAVADVRRSFGPGDEETVQILVQFEKTFEPDDILIASSVVQA